MSARQQVPFRELSQKAKMPTSPPLKDIPIDRLSKRPFKSEGGMSKNADNHRSSLLSPTASSSQSPVLRLSHRSPEGKFFEVKMRESADAGAVSSRGQWKETFWITSSSTSPASLPFPTYTPTPYHA